MGKNLNILFHASLGTKKSNLSKNEEDREIDIIIISIIPKMNLFLCFFI